MTPFKSVTINQLESPKGCRPEGVPIRKGLRRASGVAEQPRAGLAASVQDPVQNEAVAPLVQKNEENTIKSTKMFFLSSVVSCTTCYGGVFLFA